VEDGRKEWSDWIPGKTIGAEEIDYPNMPKAPLFLVQYTTEKSAVAQRGWFNPALGAIWWHGQAEPTFTHRESMIVHRELTSVLVSIDSCVIVSGRRGTFPVWHKAVLKPAGLGEAQLIRGILIEEGYGKGQTISDPAYFRALVPNKPDYIDGLISSGAIIWDDRRKCVKHKVGVGRG